MTLPRLARVHRPKVLVVGLVTSIHFARWLEHFKDSGIDFRLVGSGGNRYVHPLVKKLVSNQSHASTYRFIPLMNIFSYPLWKADTYLKNAIRLSLLQKIYKYWKPDVVHALEFQNGAYLVSDSIKMMRSAPKFKFAVTNYGSDIYWFQQFNEHLLKISEVLQKADAYSCECERDVKLARKLGFTGTVMPVVPNAGGVDVPNLDSDVQSRFRILIKGYDGIWGRASIAVEACELVADKLIGKTITLYSANKSVVKLARDVEKRTGLTFEIHESESGKYKLSQDLLLRKFQESLIYVGLSTSDGVSTSMLEAMANGAFPIQSSTACADEWLETGTTGYIVDWSDVRSVSEAISTAITRGEMRLEASKKNLDVIKRRASRAHVHGRVKNYYSDVIRGEAQVPHRDVT